jgi:hypothetical protein
MDRNPRKVVHHTAICSVRQKYDEGAKYRRSGRSEVWLEALVDIPGYRV